MSDLGNRLLWGLILVITGAATFFTWRVYQFKTGLHSSTTNLRIPSGQQVVMYRVIDGEDILVLWKGERIRVHLLGIKTPDPNQSDRQSQIFGKQAVSFLRENYVGKSVEIQYDEFKTTREKNPTRRRLLAYVFEQKKDLGLQMVSRGVAFVYEKYAFSRIKQYLRAEQVAIEGRRGFWGNKAIRTRYLQQKAMWRKIQR